MAVILPTCDRMEHGFNRDTYIEVDAKLQPFSIVVTGNNDRVPDLLGDFLNHLKF